MPHPAVGSANHTARSARVTQTHSFIAAGYPIDMTAQVHVASVQTLVRRLDIVATPDLIICDEAVSALDVSVQAQILNLLREAQSRLGLGLLFITHDLRVAAQLCDRVIVMHQGRIVEQGRTTDLYANPKQDYTRRLLEAAPAALPPTEHPD